MVAVNHSVTDYLGPLLNKLTIFYPTKHQGSKIIQSVISVFNWKHEDVKIGEEIRNGQNGFLNITELFFGCVIKILFMKKMKMQATKIFLSKDFKSTLLCLPPEWTRYLLSVSAFGNCSLRRSIYSFDSWGFFERFKLVSLCVGICLINLLPSLGCCTLLILPAVVFKMLWRKYPNFRDVAVKSYFADDEYLGIVLEVTAHGGEILFGYQ